MAQIIFESIGVIHTTYKEKKETPIQGVYSPDGRGEVELFPKYISGLKDVEGFSHLILIYHFHCAETSSLLMKPFLDNQEKGIFSIRHFNRPNHIGLSVVRLYSVKENILEIGEVDIIDGTPLLDIKPYVPDFDIRQNVRAGWYEYASNRRIYEKRKGVQP